MNQQFIPRIFGILLLVAGTAYVIGSVTAIVLPEHRPLVSKILTPFYLGEVPVIFWLMLKGARESHHAAGFQAA